jgi:iron(III) transport system permease protein
MPALLLWLIAALMALPVVAILAALLTPTPDVWAHLWNTILPQRVQNTLLLVAGVTLSTFALGTGLAWLVVAYRFPGQRLFDWLLLLPLAVPSYVLGYVYMATLDYAGPVQTALRAWLGPDVGFNVRTGFWAVLVLALTLYPYVYVLARAAFYELSGSLFDAAQAMGHTRRRAFWVVALPLARPSIVAGVVLALMEALTDFAVVRFFNFPTLSEGIIRVWHGMMNREAATEIAGLLLLFALAVLLVERWLRGRARFTQSRGQAPGLSPIQLKGWRGWAATALCAAVLLLAFGLPVAQLGLWAVRDLARLSPDDWAWYGELARHSLTLASSAAVITALLAVALVASFRLSANKNHPLTQLAVRLATLGYAVPGSVIAVGALTVLSRADSGLNTLIEGWRGIPVGLLFTGTVVGLLYGYGVRFLAVAYGGVEASFEKLKPSLTEAARTLGASPQRVLARVQLPLIAPGLLAGMILVFVDVMKELPITLLLRPFSYDTLAIWIWQMVSESMWAGTALPSLTLVTIGLLPVIVLMRLTHTPRRGRGC